VPPSRQPMYPSAASKPSSAKNRMAAKTASPGLNRSASVTSHILPNVDALAWIE
jgi:hypothetical protein